MKRLNCMRILLIVLAVSSLFAVSCTTNKVIRTVTVDNYIFSPDLSVTATAPSTVITPVFTTTPPDIPHVYLINEMSNPYVQGPLSPSGQAICFECHSMPSQHELWQADPTSCLDCHRVSDNPILNP